MFNNIRFFACDFYAYELKAIKGDKTPKTRDFKFRPTISPWSAYDPYWDGYIILKSDGISSNTLYNASCKRSISARKSVNNRYHSMSVDVLFIVPFEHCTYSSVHTMHIYHATN